MQEFPFKSALAIVTFLGMLMAFPRVASDLRSLDRATVRAVMEFPPESLAAGEIQDAVAPSVADNRLVDPAGDLARFYAALESTERRVPGAITRIVHYGDSPTTADMITGDVRRLLQHRFGDAGHGFSLVAKPWAWYEHRDVGLRDNGWTITAASMTGKNDGLFGLGGVSVQSSAGSSRLALRDPGHTGAEVDYLKQPGGGSFSLTADGVELGRVPTGAPARAAGFAHFRLPAKGARTIEIHANGAGPVRLFGIILEKPGPGISYDSLGMNGAHVALLAHNFNEPHWAEQLQHRRPDLVVLNYGTNESGFASFVGGTYEKELRLVVKRLRGALPGVSLLLMSPMDRGERGAAGEIVTLATIPKLVAIQERVARDTGCAFFNTFEAMGGSGTMARWYEAHPRMVSADFIHPSLAGAKLVGNLLYQALTDGFTKYKLKRMREKYNLAGAGRATTSAGVSHGSPQAGRPSGPLPQPAANAPGEGNRPKQGAETPSKRLPQPAANAPGEGNRPKQGAETPSRPLSAPAANTPGEGSRPRQGAETTSRPLPQPAANIPGGGSRPKQEIE